MTIKGFVHNPKAPGFKDYRASEDGVMIADVGFKRQLWALDPELDVVWDWAAEKWEIWRFPGQKGKKKKRIDHKAMHVMTVQTQGRTFRELGTDVLLTLQEGDTTRFSVKELADFFDQQDENIQRAKRKDLMNHMEAIKLDSDRYVREVYQAHVPLAYQIKPSEEKLMIKVDKTERPNRHTFKLSTSLKIARSVGGP